MNLVVNGEARTEPDGATVAALVAAVAPSPKGVAVAVNGEVVPRSTWGDRPLAEGDRVELLAPHQGG